MYAKGYQFEIISDIGNGINYNKKGLNQLIDMITNLEVDKIVILYKDRLIRFGYELIENLCEKYGTTRFIYNWILSRQEENYKNGGKFISDRTLKKSELNWLNEVSNNMAKQAVKDACLAYKRFFKGLSDKTKFKSKRKSKKSFYNDNVKLKVK